MTNGEKYKTAQERAEAFSNRRPQPRGEEVHGGEGMKEPDYTIADSKTVPSYWSVYTIFSPTMGFFCERDYQTGRILWCISFDGAKKFDAYKDGVNARVMALSFADHCAEDAEVRCYRRCDVYPEEYNRVAKAVSESDGK